MSEIMQSSSQPGPNGGLVVTQQLIEEFLEYLQAKGRTPETVATYRSYLKRVYAFLPESQEITKGTLRQLWAAMEADHYATSTINVSISAANSLLEYCDRRDLQLPLRAKNDAAAQPELTRGEYQRLLQTARRQGKEQTYLLIKLFATTGINVQELKLLTVEAAEKGYVAVKGDKGGAAQKHIPRCLCTELENYAQRQNITSGPMFLNKQGLPLNRATVFRVIVDLSDDAGVPRELCSPRALQRLYQATQEQIEQNIFIQVQRMHELLIDQEQLAVAWNPLPGSAPDGEL